MKGILLAGGSGSRLYPASLSVSKQLLPVYDKPTVYYPLSTLMLAGIKEILVISTERDLPLLQSLLGTGEQWGLKLEYKMQPRPDGIAQALILGEEFLGGDSCCLVLGDNIFYGHDVPNQLTKAAKVQDGAVIFGYHVQDPERYGVVTFDKSLRVQTLEEKPKNPPSNWAVTGLYFYDGTASKRAKALKPSPRGELEITDLNKSYLSDGKLSIDLFGRGVAWLDTGTHDSLLSASIYVQTIEKRQGLKIACLEEVAYRQGFISLSQLKDLAEKAPSSSYGLYLKSLAQNPDPI